MGVIDWINIILTMVIWNKEVHLLSYSIMNLKNQTVGHG